MVIPSTIDELISMANSEISFRNFHSDLIIMNEATGDSIRVPIESLLGKYRYFLDEIVITVKLYDDEFEKYRYAPKTLSDRLYGTTELWSGILAINHCISVIDFNKNPFKIYDPQKIKNLLNEILILEKVIT